MRARKAFCLVFSLLLSPLVVAPSVSARANSGPPQLPGTYVSGIRPAEEYELTLTKEHVSFDVPDFPLPQYPDEEKFFQYKATVTSEYVIINQTKDTVVTRFLLPLGMPPSYANDATVFPSDHFGLYLVTSGDKPVETTYRHTFYPENGHRNYSENACEPANEPIVRDGISPDTPVYRYSCSVLDAPGSSKIHWDVTEKEENQIVVYDEALHPDHSENATHSFSGWAEEGSTVNIYSVGEEVSLSTPQLRDSSGKAVSGTLNVSAPEVMTFYDLALLKKTSDGISDTDRYNAVLEFFTKEANGLCSESDLRLEGKVMRWLSFQLVFLPFRRVTCRTVCPVYPAIDRTFNPYVYDYAYCPAPRDRWNTSNALSFDVTTSHYLIRSSEAWETTDLTTSGYRFETEESDSVDELTFSLSKSYNPKSTLPRQFSPLQIFAIVMLALLGAIGIVLIFSFVPHRRK